MSKKVVIGAVVAVVMFAALAAMVYEGQDGWDTTSDTPISMPFMPDDNGNLSPNSLNFVLFETYGPLMLILGTLMFGSIIAGVAISREEEDSDDSD